jgi:hypothetical protein
VKSLLASIIIVSYIMSSPTADLLFDDTARKTHLHPTMQDNFDVMEI